MPLGRRGLSGTMSLRGLPFCSGHGKPCWIHKTSFPTVGKVSIDKITAPSLNAATRTVQARGIVMQSFSREVEVNHNANTLYAEDNWLCIYQIRTHDL